MNRIGIFGRLFGDQHISDVQSLFDELESRGKEILIYQPFIKYLEPRIKLPDGVKVFAQHDSPDLFDCLFSIGGDGTILESLTIVGDSETPIFGINTGRLGFLSTIKMEDVKEALKSIDDGKFFLESRMLMGIKSSPQLFGEKSFGLNEVVVHKKDTSSMIAIHTYINDEILNTYWADGLIVSTPTGSTAYSLSCGGPLITPGSENFVINPVAPHSLTSRPFITSSNDRIKLRVEGRGKYFLVSIDSRMETFNSDLEIELFKCDFSAKLLRLENQTFLETLSNKLNWGLDQRN